MSNDGRTSLDLTCACWHCQYWAGLIERVHAKCSRANASLQASPATGCAYWTPGAGDSLPTNWKPIDLQVPECHGVWGTPVPVQRTHGDAAP